MQQLNQQSADLQQLQKMYEQKTESLTQKIETLASLSQHELKTEFFNLLEAKSQSLINERLAEVKEVAQIQASQIIVDTMEGLTDNLVNDNCLATVRINEESAKGRVIGRNGRNKKVFEALTKTDLIIDKDEDAISVSSHNPIRREIANQLLTQLVNGKIIEPAKIEMLYETIKNDFEKNLFEIGKQAVEVELKIFDLPQTLYPYIGRLKYRSSYGQNTLRHVIECAYIANHIALELKLNAALATKCALLHDIGKAIDYEINQSHVEAGLEIIDKLDLPREIINSIESHHGQVAATSIYAQIAKLADTISAARPGARINSANEFFERMQTLENLVKVLPEVVSVYALKSGRQLRVFVNPSKIDDGELE